MKKDLERILRPFITEYMGNLPSFSDFDEPALWNRWKQGMKDGKSGAEKILAIAVRVLLELGPFEDM